jgi:hypothetical protein
MSRLIALIVSIRQFALGALNPHALSASAVNELACYEKLPFRKGELQDRLGISRTFSCGCALTDRRSHLPRNRKCGGDQARVNS